MSDNQNCKKRGRYYRYLIDDHSDNGSGSDKSLGLPRTTEHRRKKLRGAKETSVVFQQQDRPLIKDHDRINPDSAIIESADEQDCNRNQQPINENFGNQRDSSEPPTGDASHENAFHIEDHPEPPTEQADDLNNRDDPLYEGSTISNLEAFLCIMTFILRFKLTGLCVNALINLINLLLPKNCNIPGSRYMFYKSIPVNPDEIPTSYQVHYFCNNCTKYIGMYPEEGSVCSECDETFSYVDSETTGSFFLYMPLAEQLKNKFEHCNLHTLVNTYKREMKKLQQPDIYRCVLDGEFYRSLDIIDDDDTISIQWSTDGLPIFKSNGYAIWPIQCSINELPQSEKKRNIMVAGIWFGKKKPEMQECFLKPFVEELQRLKAEGFSWKNENGDLRNTKVLTLSSCCDAPARAMIQNFIQYNGKYGCAWCYHMGKQIAQGAGTSRIYPLNEIYPLRTTTETLQHACLACTENWKKPPYGIKGPSTLMKLAPGFDLIDSFIPDYLHAVLLGVTRRYVNLFLDCPREDVYHVDKEQLDDRISNSKVTHEFARTPRSLKEVKYFKATEWRTILFFSPFLFHGLFRHSTCYKHWLLLPYAIQLLLGAKITEQDILQAEKALRKFVYKVQDFYEEGEQTYNVHLLLHLPRFVRLWGPLWAQSAFVFEDNLGKLKQLHHGTKAVPQQIFTAYLRECVTQKYVSELNSDSTSVTKFVQDMRRGYPLTKKHIVDTDGVTAFGKPKYMSLTLEQANAINNYVGKDVVVGLSKKTQLFPNPGY